MCPVTTDLPRTDLRSMLESARACLDATCDGSADLPEDIVDDLIAARLLVSTALVALGPDAERQLG